MGSARIEIHLFSCGQGDTILLRLREDVWFLIDCNLGSERKRSEFIKYVEDLGVTRLEYVFLTHPDYDHFSGMAHILEYFSKERDGVGRFFDSGLNEKTWKAYIGQGPGRTELALLHDLLMDDDALELEIPNANCDPIRVLSDDGDIRVRAIWPTPKQSRQLQLDDRKRIEANPKAKGIANEFSLLLTLEFGDGPGQCLALLTADASSGDILEGIRTLSGKLGVDHSELGFRALKVPHHGSHDSHDISLTDLGNSDSEKLALVSAGNGRKHPSRRVLSDYLDSGWTVLCTNSRRNKGQDVDRIVDLMRRKSDTDVSEQNVRVWKLESEHMRWTPESSRLSVDDLNLFEH